MAHMLDMWSARRVVSLIITITHIIRRADSVAVCNIFTYPITFPKRRYPQWGKHREGDSDSHIT